MDAPTRLHRQRRTDERRTPRQRQVVCGRHVKFGKKRPVGGNAGKDADGEALFRLGQKGGLPFPAMRIPSRTREEVPQRQHCSIRWIPLS